MIIKPEQAAFRKKVHEAVIADLPPGTELFEQHRERITDAMVTTWVGAGGSLSSVMVSTLTFSIVTTVMDTWERAGSDIPDPEVKDYMAHLQGKGLL